MKNRINSGETIPYTNGTSTDIASGDVVPLAAECGIAGGDIAVGADGTLAMEGQYEVPAVNNVAFSQGAQLYWDAVAGKATTTAQGNTALGKAAVAKLTAGTTCRVRLNR